MLATINQYFKAAAFKYLSSVDVPNNGSNQHELGGLFKAGIGTYLGKTRKTFQSNFAWVDDDADPIVADCTTTWYDTRENNPNRGPEWRLYYVDNAASMHLHEGAFFLFALTQDDNLLLAGCPAGSACERQFRSIFNLTDTTGSQKFTPAPLDKATFVLPVSSMLMYLTGVNLALMAGSEQSDLENLLDAFPSGSFPHTSDFSAFARNHSPHFDLITEPDKALDTFMERENSLFRTFEKHILQGELKKGFTYENGEIDVDRFVSLSLSVLNRRKARAGKCLENHLTAIFKANSVRFTAQCNTELKKTPDFIFPGHKEYADPTFDAALLTMLGAKTTLKERWRQVLSEAALIPKKHLFTMDSGISSDQIQEMLASDLSLVLTESIRGTYSAADQANMLSLSDFIALVKERQSAY